MLFGGCNCIPGMTSFAGSGLLGAENVGFVTAMIGAMVASARTGPARALGPSVPEVDRLAVRMITDNIVIQFVPNEKRDGLTVERKQRQHDAGRAAAHRPARRMGPCHARRIPPWR